MYIVPNIRGRILDDDRGRLVGVNKNAQQKYIDTYLKFQFDYLHSYSMLCITLFAKLQSKEEEKAKEEEA